MSAAKVLPPCLIATTLEAALGLCLRFFLLVDASKAQVRMDCLGRASESSLAETLESVRIGYL